MTSEKPAEKVRANEGFDEAAASEALNALIARAKQAQRIFATFTQAQVDEIFRRAAIAANMARVELAKMAVEETGMGIVEDKVIKNHFASEFIYNKYRHEKTCGVVFEDAAYGIQKFAEPIGLIAGVVPTTNPTSTAIFKCLLALKTRNAIVFSPHPRAKRCTAYASKIIHDAAVAAGAPEGIIGCIERPSVALSGQLMSHADVDLILATGGPGMVRAAYSSGTPAIGVGAGNTPAIIDESADYRMAVSSILLSKTFDHGVICASEQSVIVVASVYDTVCKEFEDRGAVILKDPGDIDKLRQTVCINGQLNSKVVGQSAYAIAKLAGIEVSESTKVLLAPVVEIGAGEPLSIEKLSPVLALYKAKDFEDAMDKADRLVAFDGMGHTSVLYTSPLNRERIAVFGNRVPTGRVLINSPASQGAIGDIYNFMLEPSLTLGCGSWGGNSVSENIGVKHLINIKTVAERRENMLWFRVPPKIYFKHGCLPVALRDLSGSKRAFIVTDKNLYDLGMTVAVTHELEKLGIAYEIYHNVNPDPDLSNIEEGLRALRRCSPDVIIAFGGGSPMDAAKIMWLQYENPDISFDGLAMRFMDIRKRICEVPPTGRKAILVAIPTTSGTGSEVTPFSVVTDDRTGQKYPIADYALTPTMAIIDSELCMKMPRSLTAFSGIDAVTHNLEALVSSLATPYTDGIALESLRMLFEWLPKAYEDGSNMAAREAVHDAATMAGIAFANAFLGVCHSMAHKLGARFHVAHGLANALLICQVVQYNATDNPTKMATFPQYAYPTAKARYARVADYLRLGGKTDDEKVANLIKALETLKTSLNIPSSIKALGTIDEAQFYAELDALAEEAFDDQCTGSNPRYPLISEIKGLLVKAWKGEV